MGKTPERVQLAVSKAPWEEMLGDFANVSRQRHQMIEQGAIDAEVVEDVVPQGVSEVHQTGHRGAPYDGQARKVSLDAQGVQGVVGDHIGSTGTVGDPRITPAHPSYSPARPATSNGVAEAHMPSNSEIIRWEACDAAELAAKRAAAKDRINKAKKQRAARRATGGSMLSRHTIHTTLVGEGDTGKLRHTIE